MKFVTYILDGGAQPRFGFIKNQYIIDVIRAAIWANENNGDSSFLEIPSTLKRALENWSSNLDKLKTLNNASAEQSGSLIDYDGNIIPF